MSGIYSDYGNWPTFLELATDTPGCRGHDSNLFFPDSSAGRAEMHRQIQRAKEICLTCPLLHPCHAWAHSQPARHLYGIWGGTTQPERRKPQSRQHKPVHAEADSCRQERRR